MTAAASNAPAALTVPLFDLRLAEEDLRAVAEALRGGGIGMGERTLAFERAFAARLGARHAVALSSGTAALHLAYLAAGVGPGDEVIVPSYTFTATAAAVRHCGATPVFADILGMDEPTIDPAEVERRVTPRTRAVACVHFAGYAAAADRLAELCDAHGIALIEDAAHSPSASLAGRPLGTWGLAGAFSLFSNKVLSVGEGGVLVTNDARLARRARELRGAPSEAGRLPEVRARGLEYRMDDRRSALALSRLARLDEDLARRRALTRAYRRRLSAHPALVVPFPEESVDRSSCYAMPVYLCDGALREPLRARLRERHGVQTSVLYEPVHRFTAFREQCGSLRLPRTEEAAAGAVALPLFPHMTEAQQEHVLDAVEQELGE